MNRTSTTKILAWLALALLAALQSSRADASRLFFSTSRTDATLENPTFHTRTGETLEVYLFWQRTDDDVVIGAGHDIVLSNPILSRDLPTGMEADPSYLISNPSVTGQQRWSSLTSGGNHTSTVIVNDANTARTGGSNLGYGGTNDSTYDPETDTYRFGTLILNADAAGRTEVRYGIGAAGIAFNSGAQIVNFGFDDTGLISSDARRFSDTAVSVLADAIIYVAAADKPWLNPFLALDVDANGFVEPLDALIIINELNEFGSHDLAVPPAEGAGPPNYLDTNGDNQVEPADALAIINYLNGLNQDLGSLTSALAPPMAAIPEPSSMLLASLAFAGMLAAAARRKRAK